MRFPKGSNRFRKWLRIRRLIRRSEWQLVEVELAYDGRPAGNEYIERLETLESRIDKLKSMKRRVEH